MVVSVDNSKLIIVIGEGVVDDNLCCAENWVSIVSVGEGGG